MAEEINQLLKIEIDQNAVNDAIAKATEARRAMDALRESNKKLAKEEKDNTEAIVRNNIEIKKNSEVLRTNERIVVANAQAQEQSRGDIDRLRKALVAVSAQWAKTTEVEGKNSDEAQKLAKQKLDLTNKLKELEKATGDTRRNVGNYTDSIKEALEGTGAFGQGLVGMVSGLKAATAASLKFLATPLGAVLGAVALAIGGVVGAFKTLRASLERTESGQTAINRIMSSFRGIANGVLKVVEPLAEVLAEGIAIGFDLITEAILSANKAIASALEFLGADSWAEGLRSANAEIENTIKATNELASAETELLKLRREQDKLQLEFQKRAEVQRQIRDDESKSIQERIEANRELGRILDEQSQKELEIAQRALEIAQLRAEAEGESTENLDAIAEAETKILEIQERITGQRSEQLVNINSLLKEQADLEQEANQVALDALRERYEQEEVIRQEFESKATEVINDEVVRLKELYASGLIDKQKFEDEKLRIEMEALEIARLTAEIAKQNALDDLTISEAERVAIIAEAEQQILEIRERTAEAQIRLNEKAADTGIKISNDETKTKKANTNELLGLAKDSAGEQTVLSKTAGVAQATISSYTAAANALKDLPFPFNIATAALVTAKGLANVAKISAINAVGFADGGYTGDGFGLPDSSGYKPAGIVHEGEYVVKKSMVENPNFAPIVSFLENSRLKGYADGGFVGRTSSLESTQANQIASLQSSIEMISQMQPIVRVSDINRVSKESQMVKVSGALS